MNTFLRCVHRVNFITFANVLKQLCRAFYQIIVWTKISAKIIESTLVSMGWENTPVPLNILSSIYCNSPQRPRGLHGLQLVVLCKNPSTCHRTIWLITTQLVFDQILITNTPWLAHEGKISGVWSNIWCYGKNFCNCNWFLDFPWGGFQIQCTCGILVLRNDKKSKYILMFPLQQFSL